MRGSAVSDRRRTNERAGLSPVLLEPCDERWLCYVGVDQADPCKKLHTSYEIHSLSAGQETAPESAMVLQESTQASACVPEPLQETRGASFF